MDTRATPRAPVGQSTTGLATLFPGYFALVMATGILAVAAMQQSIEWLANGLLAVALLAYLVLASCYGLRLVRFRSELLADFTNHLKGPAFLTFVAGTNVLGSAAVIVGEWSEVGWVLWVTGMVLWIVLTYAVLSALMLREPKPAFAQGINGTWFLFAVATQSVAALGALLAVRTADPSGLLFACVCMFLVGLFLYVVVATLVVYRFAFVELRVEETLPPYWISMGAVAISTLAGSNLLTYGADSPIVQQLEPFLAGMTVFAWATATFWIPLMIVMGVWRHAVRRVPIRYDPQYWALVFPLGMYAAATFRMTDALRIDFLDIVPKVMLGAALTAWSLAIFGLLHRLVAGAHNLRASR